MSAQAGNAFRVELIEAARSGFAVHDEPSVFEHTQMLGDSGAADGQGLCEFVDGDGSGGQLLKDGHAGGIAESIESGLKVSVHLR